MNWVKIFMDHAGKNGTKTRINVRDQTIESYSEDFEKWYSWIYLKDAEREYQHYFKILENRKF